MVGETCRLSHHQQTRKGGVSLTGWQHYNDILKTRMLPDESYNRKLW